MNLEPTLLRCMFCLSPFGERKVRSVEHVVPQALGGRLTTSDLCKECNSYLGAEVDVTLTDHLFAKARRSELGLSGYSGKVPGNLIELAGIGTLGNNPDHKIKIIRNRTTGDPEVRTITNRIKSTSASTTDTYIVDSRMPDREIAQIIEKAVSRAGGNSLTAQEMVAKISEIRAAAQSVERPDVLFHTQVDVAQFQRGMLKICYELAVLWLGPTYLDDPMGTILRRTILGELPNNSGLLQGRYTIGPSCPLQ